MANRLDIDPDKLVKAVAEVLENDRKLATYGFTEEEVEVLKAVILFVERLQALRWFGRILFWLIISAATLVVNWQILKHFFGERQ